MRLSSVPAVLIFVLDLFLAHGAAADIVGGEVVKNSDPIRSSTAALYSPSPDGRGGALCTASIIGHDTAVTAAHCIPRDGSHPVLLFGNDLKKPGTEKRAVVGERVNPAWETRQGRGMDQGDIAVVKFAGGLPEGYQSIPLATKDAERAGATATLAGYGISNAQKQSGAGVLRKTRVAVDDPRAGKSEMILDQSHGHGACHGDSGGPAFVREGGRTVVAGVTNRSYPASAPDDCGHKVVYTKVAAYRPWIEASEASLEKGHVSDAEKPSPVSAGGELGKRSADRYAGKQVAHSPRARSKPAARSTARKPGSTTSDSTRPGVKGSGVGVGPKARTNTPPVSPPKKPRRVRGKSARSKISTRVTRKPSSPRPGRKTAV